jgi:DNA-binding winged helix-turn-helix (wHTH) protein/tetratricopeptide (TPR) repeat protein/tRNA A-37 threonylcarbamoyl transferase component Bud32
MEHPAPGRARFGGFELDLKSGELCSIGTADGNNNKVLLREQSFQVLRMLVERGGKIVTRDEIKAKLWPNDTVVDFDHSINATIKTLRRALGDSADNPQYIETLARRGYRLMLATEWLESTAGVPRGDASRVETFREPTGLVGKKVSHYRVLEVIGGGGMGMVYKAEDLKLGRQVALKFLPEELASDPVALKRFEREAQTASALNHPNICTIYEIEEHGGEPFIVMELLEGDTLRNRMAASEPKTIPVLDLLDIATQVSNGLQAAHDKDIIHRDIKPANIFLCKSGTVKILDFGLAKLAGSDVALERAEAASTTVPKTSSTESLKRALTRTGTTAGTAGYMSPEQVRYEELDTRSDLFSFGLVVYEMACGQRAFTGQTLVDVHEAILHQPAAPARARNPVLPRSLDLVLAKALEKDRDRRYQSATALKDDLARITREVHPARRWTRRALAAGVLLAAGALSIWRYEVYRHRITLAPTDTIVLADVDNRTNDPVFDDALNSALRYEMEQTPYLNLLGLDKAYATMGQLKLAPTTKITPEIARQICGKTNSKMVISDSIADAGNRYHLEIRALDCGSVATLAEERTDISARNQVVHELGATAVRLRRKLGEPAESLARFNQPLEKATSASLEALQVGAEGTKLFLAGNPQAALPLYQRAIELDPELALTYEGIGAANGALGHFDLLAASLTRAYQLRDRMTEKDRVNIDYLYYTHVTGEVDKAYSILVRSLELFPRDVFFHTNLAFTLLKLGQLKRVADLQDETARLDPSPLYFSWAASANINASRFNEAGSWLAQAEALKFDSLELRIQRFRLAFIEGDRAALDRIFNGEAHGPNRVVFLRQRSEFEAQQGHLDSANRLDLQTLRLASNREDISWDLVYSARQNAEAGKVIQAHKTQDQALQLKLGRNQKMVLALSLARSGRTDEAERLADEVSQEAPSDLTVQRYLVPTVRAAVKLQQHDPTAAINLLRGTVQYDLAVTNSFDFLYPAYIRGLAFLESGDGRSAAGEFQKLIDNPGMCWEYITGPLARLQLGRAQRLMGDNASARKSYEEFLSIWKDSDADLPVYRQAKAEYAKLGKN